MMTSSLLNKALSLNSDSNLLIKQKECILGLPGDNFAPLIHNLCPAPILLAKPRQLIPYDEGQRLNITALLNIGVLDAISMWRASDF